MKLTMEIVRTVLRNTFGVNSFIASFIRAIEECKVIPTAGIRQDGVLAYNPEFTRQRVRSPESLFCLIVHELLHPMFGHFVHGAGRLENLAADIVINAAISRLFAEPSGRGALFREFYAPRGIEGLLRPDSEMSGSRYQSLYVSFYAEQGSRTKLSTGEVIQTLRVLTPSEDYVEVVLLGTHGQSDAASEFGSLSAAQRSKVAEDLKRVVGASRGRDAGFSYELQDLLIEVLNSSITFRKVLLDRYETQKKIDRFRKETLRPALGLSPIPISPSKRDLVLLAADMLQLHYRNRMARPHVQYRGLAIYLDVSGSALEHLPKIISLIRGLKGQLLSVYAFSNRVVELPLAELARGCISTTGGTDFNCVAQSILDSRFDRAVILTDGYAALRRDLKDELREQQVKVLTVLFGGARECPDLQAVGDMVQLADVCA